MARIYARHSWLSPRIAQLVSQYINMTLGPHMSRLGTPSSVIDCVIEHNYAKIRLR